jgi:glycosyltransferase 2 family protein
MNSATSRNQARVPGKPNPFRRGKLAFGAVGFVLLTGGVFWYQFSRVAAGAAAPTWDDLRWGYLALILLCLPLETVTCGLRTWVMTRVLQPSVSLLSCIKAEWANVAISTLTPTQSWGGPGQIYVLSRGGASVGTSLTIMLLSCVATLVALLALALYSLLVSNTDGAWPLFLTVIWSFLGIGSAMTVVAIWPGPFRAALAALSRTVWRLRGRRRPLQEWWSPEDAQKGPAVDCMGPLTAKLVNLIYTYRADVSRFLRQGKAAFACVCLLSLPFPIARAVIAYLCLRFLGIQASDFRHILEAQLILILLEFFAPSPGGAGVMEMASLAVMGEVVSAGYAPYYNLLWRSSTLYLPALAGFACLALALLQDAGRAVQPTWNRTDLDECGEPG